MLLNSRDVFFSTVMASKLSSFFLQNLKSRFVCLLLLFFVCLVVSLWVVPVSILYMRWV